MNQSTALDVTPFKSRNSEKAAGRISSVFEEQFLQQLLLAARPQIEALVREVIAGERSQPLIVDYEEAGRMIGTTYEGIRKLVRNGKLTAVSRSGRHRGIAIAELKDYVHRNQQSAQWHNGSRTGASVEP
jgi:excisionase family DNA binding protein